MKPTELRTLIKESIQEYIREVETSGNIAAQEAKIRACEEAIAIREKKINLEGLDETMHEMIDKSKLNELKKEVKELQKYKTKAESLLEKMRNKAEGKSAPKKMEDKDVEEAVIDEINIDETFPESGAQLEEDQLDEAKKMTAAQKEKKEDIVKGMKKSKSFGKSKEEKGKMYATATKLAMKESVETEGETLNESFLHMQKLAGLITETQYKQKIEMLNEVDTSAMAGAAKNLYLYLSKMKPNDPLDVNGSPLKNVKGDPITYGKKVKMTYQNSSVGMDKLAAQGKAKDLGGKDSAEINLSYSIDMIYATGFVKKQEAEAALDFLLKKFPQIKGEIRTHKMDYEWAKNYAPKYVLVATMKKDKEIASAQSAKPTA